MNIEYELEKDDITLYDLTISIPLPAGSYPTVGSSPTGEWALNTTTHSLDWTVPIVSAQDDSRSANLEFTVGGDDASAFYPVLVSFIGVGSVAGISVGLSTMVSVADTYTHFSKVANVALVETQSDVSFSEEARVVVDSFTVVRE